VKPAAAERSRGTRRVARATRAVAAAGGAATQEDVEEGPASVAAGAADEMSAGQVQDDPGDPQSRRPRWLHGLDAKVADAESVRRTDPAKKGRASKEKTGPAVGISLAEAQGAIETVALPEPRASAAEPVAEPVATTVSEPKDDEPTLARPEAPEASATDPEAWDALAKTLRRNALGEDAASGPAEPEGGDSRPETVSEQAGADLRARLARASAKKRRSVDGTADKD